MSRNTPGRTTPPTTGRIGPTSDESVTSPLRSKSPLRQEVDDVKVVDVEQEPAHPKHLKAASFSANNGRDKHSGTCASRQAVRVCVALAVVESASPKPV